MTETPSDAKFSDSAKNASAQTWTEKWFRFLLRISTEMVRIHPRISPDEVRIFTLGFQQG